MADKAAFSNCTLAEVRLPLGLSEAEITQLEDLSVRQRTLKKREKLFHEGQAFSHIAIIRSGSFKAYKFQADGCERIFRFYFPGEILGFHAICRKHYAVTAIALEASGVCEIAYNDLLKAAQQLPSLQQQLFKIMSQRLLSDFTIDPSSHADERIAKFLLSLSSRFSSCGYSATEFNLSMSREDIGHYLGLATETVSRILTKLCEENILTVNRREVVLKNFRKLQKKACG